MFGLKFRSWMESHIVRPRKKQQQQHQQQQPPPSRAKGKGVPDRALDSAGNSPTSPKSNGSRPHHASASATAAASAGVATAPGSCGISLLAHAQQRPTAHSLSSPESAYSTGYSTDGTSPGASFPPEYYINLRTGTHYFHNQQAQPQVTEPTHRRTESCDVGAEVTHLEEAVPSPRQRNRIRTNPWLAGSSLSSSGSSSRHQPQQQVHRPSSSGSDVTLPRRPDVVSPISNTCAHPTPPAVSPRVLSPRRSSLCSSASSSTSSSQSTAASSSMHTPNNLSAEEDDVTLNEMLGKFDESYVYEKETDILSDSDPTDCEEDTDFDTGQDGGDENDDDDELDFIDDGSCLDLDPQETEERCSGRNINKGHCTYHIPVAGHPDLPAARKPPMRFRESFMRRSSNRRHQQPGIDEGTNVTNSPGASSRHSSLRKLPEEGFLHQNRRSSNRHRRHEASHVATNTNPTSTRNPSEKKRVRCSMRRNVNLKENTVVANENSLVNSIQSGQTLNRENMIDSGGVLNLNRVLMQKMLERSNMTGTRSAGNTPVSLRRRILNGDVPDIARKTFSPSKLISQEVNKNRLAHDNGNNTCSLDIPTSPKTANNSPKQRSNSVSYTAGMSESHKAMQSSNYLATFASEMALIEADKEADRKYKELILEAEHILVSMKGNIPDKCINFMVPKPKPFFLKSNYIIDGFPKPKPFNPIPNKVGDQHDRLLNDNDITAHSEMVRSKLNSPKRIIDGLSVQKHSQDSQNGNLPSTLDNERNRQCNREVRKVLLSPRRRQNKTARNVPICGSSSSESDGSTTPQQEEKPFTPKIPVSCSTNNFQKPSLVTFRSIDLGNAIDSSRYCPQSEPVKRKVYSCSATFDRLQKTLEKSQHTSLRYKAELTRHGENGVEKSGRESLKEKLKQLRKERLEVEAKVREAQEDERRRRDDKSQCQRQLSLFRRQMLVHTIEGLKRSLEDQSAKLQETYQSTENSPLISRRHSSSSVNRQIEQEVHEEEQ